MIESGQKQKRFKWVNLRFRRALAGILIVFLMFPVNLPLALAQQSTSGQAQSAGVAADTGLGFQEEGSSEGEGAIARDPEIIPPEADPNENPEEITELAPEVSSPQDEAPSITPPAPEEPDNDVDEEIPEIAAPVEESPETEINADVPEVQLIQDGNEEKVPQAADDARLQIETKDQASVTIPVTLPSAPIDVKSQTSTGCGPAAGALMSTDLTGTVDKNLYAYGENIYLNGKSFNNIGTAYYTVDTVPPSGLPGWPISGSIPLVDRGGLGYGFLQELVLTPAQYAAIVGVGGSGVVFKATAFSDSLLDCKVSSDNWKVEGEPEDPVLEITKTTNDTTVTLGEKVTYSITVANTGNIDLTDVLMEDDLPAGLEFFSASRTLHSSSSTSTGSLVWDIGDLAFGDSESIDVTAITTKAGGITNTAYAGSKEVGPVKDSATVFVAKYEMDIVKSTNDTTVFVGDPVEFELKVTNTGNADISAIWVSDFLPAQLVFDSSDPTADSTNPLTWNLGPLAPGQSHTIKVTAIATEVGVFTNSAMAWSEEAGQVADDATITALERPKYGASITKVDSVDPIQIGKNTVYTIKVKNTGDTTLTQVELTDNLPDAFGFVSSSEAPYSGQSLWKLGTLAPGEEHEIKVKAKGKKSGTFTNIAEVNAAELNQPEQASEPTKVLKPPEVAADTFKMEITKSDDVDPATVGETVTYTVTVKNTGTGVLTGLSFDDSLPTGLEFLSSDLSVSDVGDGVLAWNISKLDPGKSRTFKIRTTAKQAGSWTNTVSVITKELPSGENANEQTEVVAEAVEASEEPVAESLPQTGFPTTIWFLAAILSILAGLWWETKNRRINLQQNNWASKSIRGPHAH